MLPNGNNGYHPKSPQFMGGREPMGRFSPDRQQFIPEDRPQSGRFQEKFVQEGHPTARKLALTGIERKRSFDPDGLDLHFTMSNRLFHGTQTSVLVNQVRGHQCQGSSNMGHRLTTIMATYKAQLRDQYNFRQGHLDDATKEYVRPVNYYIFTDGRWDPGCEPDSAIKELTELMVELDVEENQVGIQFISFGNDKAGLANLKRLDDDLDVEM
ncbi:hypothetical protein M7I_0022 [Glarea lozoyensis 74030]|uniref:VWFA domain-containing protein n=1 Tax=Glarea lozoyensis (strain ATCC 74030 / MF5533) TaxID=1104152 RepID=H0EC89_GLAL7|nr:hypothetical protein M7I_0022 [Glarea lozoyensis 74030]